MQTENLADLPEVVPLQRVAPIWRVLAILAAIGVLLLLFAVLGMAVVISSQSRQLQLAGSPTWKGPPMAMAPAIATAVLPENPLPPNTVNLPYPVQDDLRALREPNPPEALQPVSTPRERFLAKSREIWKAPRQDFPQELSISPDGQSLAYFQGTHLVAGPLANPQLIQEPEAQAAFPTRPLPGVAVAPAAPLKAEVAAHLVGMPAWSADSRYVYFGSNAGRLQRFDARTTTLEPLPFRGLYPLPLPTAPRRLVFVRHQAAPQSDAPGAPAGGDPVEIVIANLEPAAKAEPQVVVTARPIQYRHPAISADGRWLAVWALQPARAGGPESWRVLRIDLSQRAVEPELLEVPATDVPGALCWSRDGKHLLYAREPLPPLPADCWTDAEWLPYERCNLYQWDLAAKAETRLSRGGGCLSLSLDRDDGLCYLTWPTKAGRVTSLRRLPLTAARAFVAAEPELPVRDRAAWTALIEQVWQDAKGPPAGAKLLLTEDLLARLAAALEREFPLHFKEPLPAGLAGLDRLEQETQGVLLPEVERRWRLVLAAARGDYLRKHHAASWHLVADPDPAGQAQAIENRQPFAYVVNLFQFQDRPPRAGEPGSLGLPAWLLQQAEGRALVLTNDSRAAQAAADQLVDPDLAQGTALLQQGKAKEGEKLLGELLKKPQHQKNYHLVLAVGQLLYQHKRTDALQRLMEVQCLQQPTDARKFNLLGLSLLERQPREAASAFKKALRCDLSYGPGYLNLAQAYRLSNDTPSALACLRRYLELEPGGAYSGDAAQRLAALEAETR